MKSSSISIIIPGFNEKKRIEKTLRLLDQFCREHFQMYEIICVDDGSYDQTEKIVKNISKELNRIIILRYTKNMGKGYAIRYGMAHAKGEFIFFTDADLPYNPMFFCQAMDLFKQKQCDIVVGNRHLRQSRNEANLSQKRKWASHTFSQLVRRLLKISVTDTQCGIKGFSRSCVQKLIQKSFINGYAFDVEIFVLSRSYQWYIESLPVTLVNNQMSKIRLRCDVFKMIWELFQIFSKTCIH
jgi:dolichyl-phosphate beta-glucosyltransferase